MNSRVLITGSSGYIGSHFVKYFAKQGITVFGLDQNPPLKTLDPYIKSNIEADIADSECVGAFIKKHDIKQVVHCAALCLVGESVEKPDMYQENNVEKSKIFLKTLLDEGVQNLVFSSTAAVYGEPRFIPITEDHPKNPINPYGETKLEFENILFEAGKTGLNVGIMRYFNAAGADPDTEIGECHDPETHLIPNALKALLGQAPKLQIFGNDYDTRDGTCERDYIHVFDLADAHLKLLQKLQSATSNHVAYNLGLGVGYTINEVVQEIEKQTGKTIPKEIKPRRPGDPAKLVASPQKAIDELGWKPQWSDLPTIIKTALRWHEKKSG